jgi:hypothetical protein
VGLSPDEHAKAEASLKGVLRLPSSDRSLHQMMQARACLTAMNLLMGVTAFLESDQVPTLSEQQTEHTGRRCASTSTYAAESDSYVCVVGKCRCCNSFDTCTWRPGMRAP